MADEKLYAITADQAARISAMLDWFEQGAPSREWKRQREPARETRRRRFAKTTTASGTASYPTAASGTNTFWCKFIDAVYDGGYAKAEEGNHTATFTDWPDGEKVLAHSRRGAYIEEGTVVELDQFNGQWWISEPPRLGAFYARGGTSAAITPPGGVVLPTTVPLETLLYGSDLVSLSSNTLTVQSNGTWALFWGATISAGADLGGGFLTLANSVYTLTTYPQWSNYPTSDCVTGMAMVNFSAGDTMHVTATQSTGSGPCSVGLGMLVGIRLF